MNTVITVTDKTILYGSEAIMSSLWCQKIPSAICKTPDLNYNM